MAIKIGIDCGHGLKTAGKQTPDGIKEWTLNDKVRDKVVAFLSEYDCEIIHTDNNEGNTDETLASRVNAYMNKGVAAFVSIHHNAYTGKWNNATGVEVFTDKNPTAKDTALANAIYPKLVSYTGLKGRGIKKEDWWVINQNRIPAVLVEGGFMDGSNDYKVITSEAGQTAYAKAVAEGLIEFLGLKKKETNTTTTTVTSTAANFLIKVDKVSKGDVLNIRKEPNANSAITGRLAYNDPNCYTIVETKNGWGLLKSKIGWVNLYYTKTVAGTAPAPTTAEPSVSYFTKYTGTSGSIVTALKTIGADSSFSYRAKIAKANGIKGYIGTASQNTNLVTLLKQGKLVKP